MDFDFRAQEKEQKAILVRGGQHTVGSDDNEWYFVGLVADPNNPFELTLEKERARKFKSKEVAKRFAKKSDLFKKGFEVQSL